MKVAIVGSGVVGQATGVGLAKLGNEVIFHDIRKEKLDPLRKLGFEVTTEIQQATCDCDALFLCIPTPTVQGQMDCTCLKNKVVEVATALDFASKYQVVVVRSTVLPGTTRTVVIPLLDRYCRQKIGADFGLCMNPEFLREKTAIERFSAPQQDSYR